jgi:cell wall-associated NlpC family hydrolase
VYHPTCKFLVEYLWQFIGTPYRWGGDDPMAGFDCSGLVLEGLLAAGLWAGGDAPSQGIHDHYRKTIEPIPTPRLGTLLFFGSSTKSITHIAVALDALRMIEAGGGGSATTSEAAAIAQNAYVRVRPITRRRDLVAALPLD